MDEASQEGGFEVPGESLDSLLERLADYRALNAVTQSLQKSAEAARDFAIQRLRELLAECCDQLTASAAWLFHKDGDYLKAIHTIRTDRRDLVLGLDEVSVSNWVANHGRPYCTNDAQHDPNFRRSLGEKSKSAMAAPLLDHEGKLIGVACLESLHSDAFTAGDVAHLAEMAAKMTPHLLVLESIDRGDESWCPWHPRVHRWTLCRVLRQVCHAIREAIDGTGSDAIACAVWAADRPNRSLYVYANALHGSEYVENQALSFNTFMGCIAECPKGSTGRARPRRDAYSLITIPTPAGPEDRSGTPFRMESKSEAMGLEEVIAAPIHLGHGDAYGAEFVVAIYAYSEQAAASLPSPAELSQVARVLGEVIAAYEAQRVRLAASYFARVVDERRPADYKPILREMRELFKLKKARFYAYAHETYAVIGDAPGPRPLERRDGDPAYLDYLRENSGLTVRVNNPQSWRPEDFRTSDPHAWSPWRDAAQRRFLDVGVAGGVLRLIRPDQSKPFTPGDERLLIHLAAFWSRAIGIMPSLDHRPQLQPNVGGLGHAS
jgi:hypothetical protein